MFQTSAYTIFFSDSPETGRTKLNYLLSGGASPFFLWSADTSDVKQISLFKLDEDYTNNISVLKGVDSAVTNYNFIINGLNNNIDTTKYTTTEGLGGYNLISGLNNKILNGYSGNTTIGSGNTTQLCYNIFLHGLKNKIGTLQYTILSNAVSSNNINMGGGQFLFSLSSKNNNIVPVLFTSYPGFSKVLSSGINNAIENNDISGGIHNSFVLSGKDNRIELNNNFNISDSFHGIVNGTNNEISISGSSNNLYLFGSNLNSVTSGYSHFENLQVDENLLTKNIKTYLSNSAPSSQITIDTNYSFHEIHNLNQANIGIYIPNPVTDLQCLSISISAGTIGSPYLISFYDSGFSSDPTNIACKQGSAITRFTAGANENSAVAYFFMWTNIINKWVMFNSSSSLTSYFSPL